MHRRKILIIKTGYSELLEKENNSRVVSLGDILRTTPLLHIYKKDHVTWVTDKSAFPLLEGIESLDRLLPFDWITAEQLKEEKYDVVINLEKIAGICAFSDKISVSRSRYGFVFDPVEGKAIADDNSAQILAVSSDLKLKKENTTPAQELLFGLVGEKWGGEEYLLGHKSKNEEKYDVALNNLVGTKWPSKAWDMPLWDKLESLLVSQGYSVTRQDRQEKGVLTNLKDYVDWVNSSKLVVTNDSLGLHLGLALKKKTLLLSGPIPSAETYFYGRGEAILPEKRFDCLPCFLSKCCKEEFCMDSISPEKVLGRVKEYLGKK